MKAVDLPQSGMHHWAEIHRSGRERSADEWAAPTQVRSHERLFGPAMAVLEGGAAYTG